jgi:hypothetical protein
VEQLQCVQAVSKPELLVTQQSALVFFPEKFSV